MSVKEIRDNGMEVKEMSSAERAWEIRQRAKKKINDAGLALVEALTQDEDEKLYAFRRFLVVFKTEYANYLYNMSAAQYSSIGRISGNRSKDGIASVFFAKAMEIMFYGKSGASGDEKSSFIFALCARYSPEKAAEGAEFPFFEFLKANIWRQSCEAWNEEPENNPFGGMKLPSHYTKMLSKFRRYCAEHGLDAGNCDIEAVSKAIGESAGSLKKALEADYRTRVVSLDAPVEGSDGETVGSQYEEKKEAEDKIAQIEEQPGLYMSGTMERLYKETFTEQQRLVFSYVATGNIINRAVADANAQFRQMIDDTLSPDGYTPAPESPAKRERYRELRRICETENAMLQTEEGWENLNIIERLNKEGFDTVFFFRQEVLEWFMTDRKKITGKRISAALGVSEPQITKITQKLVRLMQAYRYLENQV